MILPGIGPTWQTPASENLVLVTLWGGEQPYPGTLRAVNPDPKHDSSAEAGNLKPAQVLDFRAVSEPRWSPSGSRLGWLEESLGATRFFFLNSAPDLLIDAPQSLGTRVRRTPPTYGGAWAWRDDASVVVVASDARVVLLELESGVESGPEHLLIDDALGGVASRYLAPSVSSDGEWLAVTRERSDAMEIVVVSIGAAVHARNNREHSAEPLAISSADFAWDPSWSSDGELLAWHEWSNPEMPWDSSRIVVADFHDGVVSNQRVVAGGPDTQVGQPRFSPDGTRLAWLTDSDGWLRVCVGDIDGSNAVLLNHELFEAGEAPWGAGQRSYAWSPDSKHIAWCRNEGGFGRLVSAEVGSDISREPEVVEPEVVEIAKAWHHGVSWGPQGIAAIRSGARTPPRVVIYPHSAGASSRGIEFGERVEIADGDPIGFDKETFAQGCLVEPKVLSWMSGDLEITGLLYLPPGVENPPLIFDLHGGPTGAATARWSPNVAALLSHGWGVLRPNPRGSYGSGRAHLRALDGGWGALDLDDVIAGIEAVSRVAVSSAADVDSINLNPPRIAITGGSAGGMLALLVALLRPDLVKACISVYGVTDLFSLAETDYRFEKHYAQRLVGELPEARDLYVERSPITHAHRLSVPTLMLHGDADEVVPVAQMRDFVAAARAGGAEIESHEYAGEGHGWSRPETIRDDFDRSVAFLEKWLSQ